MLWPRLRLSSTAWGDPELGGGLPDKRTKVARTRIPSPASQHPRRRRRHMDRHRRFSTTSWSSSGRVCRKAFNPTRGVCDAAERREHERCRARPRGTVRPLEPRLVRRSGRMAARSTIMPPSRGHRNYPWCRTFIIEPWHRRLAMHSKSPIRPPVHEIARSSLQADSICNPTRGDGHGRMMGRCPTRDSSVLDRIRAR